MIMTRQVDISVFRRQISFKKIAKAAKNISNNLCVLATGPDEITLKELMSWTKKYGAKILKIYENGDDEQFLYQMNYLP